MSRSRKKQGPASPYKKLQSKAATPRQTSQRSRQLREAKTPGSISPTDKGCYFLFGRNSIESALKNPARECIRLFGTEKALSDASLISIRPSLVFEQVDDVRRIAASLPEGVPHQGLLLEVRSLPSKHLESMQPKPEQKNIILMLDQVTDPQNVGACLRSAAAFGARAVITQDRNSPSESGVLARAAAGGLEALPWLRVANLAHTLEKLQDMGYWHIGLDGHTETSIREVSLGDNIVLVMGSEGSGLRPLVRKSCDTIAKIPMSGDIESLNVSNAAAIALYELTQP